MQGLSRGCCVTVPSCLLPSREDEALCPALTTLTPVAKVSFTFTPVFMCQLLSCPCVISLSRFEIVHNISPVLLSATELLLRRFSSAPPSTDVGYEQLKQLLAGRSAVVIDVREPWELREYGFIPGSINVPRECCLT